jgi:division protein CdvB (Snf7/Vps24/ESCRT-III family)
MLSGKDFHKIWAGNDKIKLPKSKDPLKTRIIEAQYNVRSMISRLDAYIARMQERDKVLFERVVDAQMSKDATRAAMYANEVAEIRKITKQLITTQVALEQVSLRLETITELGDVYVNLIPVMGVINELKTSLKGIMPELSIELSELGDGLQEVVVEAGEFSGIGAVGVASSPEARKILEEASLIAEQRMKEKFPELPATGFAQRAESH